MKYTRLLVVTVLAMLAGLAFGSCDEDNNTNGNGNEQPTPQPESDWVDLGLPSGLLWAKCNLGDSSPEEYGDYYAWGEVTTKEVYDAQTYSYYTMEDDGVTIATLSKYNVNGRYGIVDSLTVLQPEDDAATVALGSGARIPTHEEWEELCQNCTRESVSQNGGKGNRFTGTNGNSIFLPAAGQYYGSELHGAGDECNGKYWSSSLWTDNSACAWKFEFYYNNGGIDATYRIYGRSIRPVRQR